MLPGVHWLPCADADLRALALVKRHYSEALKSRRNGSRGGNGFVGPGEKMVLLTLDCAAVWAWLNPQDAMRNDGQTGVLCSVFRNESGILSSDLIREADDLAWEKWPDQTRHYTFVDPTSIASPNPGYCYQQAGWTFVRDDRGKPKRSSRGRYILERTLGRMTGTAPGGR